MSMERVYDEAEIELEDINLETLSLHSNHLQNNAEQINAVQNDVRHNFAEKKPDIRKNVVNKYCINGCGNNRGFDTRTGYFYRRCSPNCKSDYPAQRCLISDCLNAVSCDRYSASRRCYDHRNTCIGCSHRTGYNFHSHRYYEKCLQCVRQEKFS